MRSRRALLLAVAVPCALAFIGGDARADDAASDPQSGDEDDAPMIVVEPAAPAKRTPLPPAAPAAVAARPTTERRWYGWQTLMCDGAAIDLAIIGASVGSSERGNGTRVGGTIALLGLGTYLFGPPIVHWAHGKVGVGFGSLAIRALGPPVTGLTGMLVGSAFDSRGSDLTGVAVGGLIGLVVGHAIAVIVDSAAFSFETVPVTPEPAGAPKKASMPSLRWTPMLGPLVSPVAESRGVQGGVAGVGGVF